MADCEGMFFSSLLARGDPGALRGVPRAHFSEDWLAIFDWIVGFLRAEQKLPRIDTVAGQFRRPFPQAPETPSFYAEQIRENALRVAMESGFTESVAEPLKEGRAKDALAGAKQVVSDLSRDFRRLDEGLVLPDMSANVSARFADYRRRKANIDKVGIPTPFAAMTRATSGARPGDAWAVLARPCIGKTWLMVLWATYLWQMGYRVLFVSMETPPQGALPRDKNHRLINGCCMTCYMIGVDPRQPCPGALLAAQRLTVRFDAIGAVLPAWRLLKGTLSPLEERQLETYYRMCEQPSRYGWGTLKLVGAPYINSIEDLETEILAFRPDMTFWDSAYLAADNSDASRKTDAAGKLIVNTKLCAERTGCPIAISWHFNRDVDEEATHASANAAALTDELNRVFDVLIGMFRTPQLELAGEAIFRSLKVRDGLSMKELRTHFMVKDALNFAEIAEGPPGKELPVEGAQK